MRFRRRKRRWALPAALVAAVAVLVALVAQLDVDALRGRAVDGLASWIDQPVTLRGRLGLRLSDGPVLVLPEIEVGDRALVAREARVAVRFWPLLVGRIEPRSVTLVGPRIRLSTFAAWRSTAGEWPALPVERLDVVDGVVEGPEGVLFDQLQLAVVPASPAGPFDVRATARQGGEPLRLESTVGRLDSGRPVGFAAKLHGLGADASVAGAVNRGAGGLEIGGPIKITAADGRAFLARLGIVAVPLAGPGSMEAKLAWSGGRVVLSDLAFEGGGTRVTGRVDLAESLRAGEVQLAFGRLEIEAWRATIEGLLGGAGSRDLSLRLTAEALDLRGGLVRQARAEIRLLDRQMALRQLSALAPGGTEVTAFGRISSEAASRAYEGEIDLVSDNLRLALAWLGLEPAGVAPDRLRRAAVSARLTFDGTRLTVPTFDLKLDTSRMLGSGNLVLLPHPRLDLRLAVDRVALDPYLHLLASAFTSGIGGTVAASADLVTWQGIGLRDAEIDLAVADTTIELRRLRVAEVAGAQVSATGKLALDGEASDVSFDLTTRRPADLLRLLGRGDGGAIGEATVAASGRLQGAPGELRLSGAVVSPEGTGSLDGTARLSVAGDATFEPGPDLRRLIEALSARGR